MWTLVFINLMFNPVQDTKEPIIEAWYEFDTMEQCFVGREILLDDLGVDIVVVDIVLLSFVGDVSTTSLLVSLARCVCVGQLSSNSSLSTLTIPSMISPTPTTLLLLFLGVIIESNISSNGPEASLIICTYRLDVGVVALFSCVDNVGLISVGDDIPSLLFEAEEVGASSSVEVFMFML